MNDAEYELRELIAALRAECAAMDLDRREAIAQARAYAAALQEIATGFGWVQGTEGQIACERCHLWRKDSAGPPYHDADCPVAIGTAALAANQPKEPSK
jgi:hypothetical protein